MATIQKRATKDGRCFYEIVIRRGRSGSRPSMRWYPPEKWSQKAIDRELAKVATEFEARVKSGEVVTAKEERQRAAEVQAAIAQIQTLKQYAEAVFMPAIGIRAAENTRSNYQSNLNNWIYPALGDLKIPDITSAQIDAFLLNVQGQGKSHATVIKLYTILLGIFKKARTGGVITQNPMDLVERPTPRKDEVKQAAPPAYSVDMIRYIWSCIDNEPLKWRALIHLLIDSGMRRGECCGLEWKHIDFENGTIKIQQTLNYTKDKGIYIDTTKSSKIWTIDVAPHVLDLLREWRIEQSKHAISRFVFTQNDSAEPMHPQSPTRYFKKLEKKYDIPDFHPHKLRHSFASIAITNGADVASVSEKLGHSDKAITLRMYTHASEGSIRRAGNIFRDALAPREDHDPTDEPKATVAQ